MGAVSRRGDQENNSRPWSPPDDESAPPNLCAVFWGRKCSRAHLRARVGAPSPAVSLGGSRAWRGSRQPPLVASLPSGCGTIACPALRPDP